MTPKATHRFRFSLGRLGEFGDSVDLGGALVTWIDLADARWRVHPEGDDRVVGVGASVDLATLDYLARKLGFGEGEAGINPPPERPR